jgi:polyisoprenoid-binding protein YceI
VNDAGNVPSVSTGAATARYRLDPGNSRFTVQGFAGGLLAFVAHSPTFAIRDFAGEMSFDPATAGDFRLDLRVLAASLDLLDRVRASDRADIQGRMLHEVLETGRFPEIHYEAAGTPVGAIAPHQYRLRLDGRLTVHGITNSHGVEAQLSVHTDGARLTGESALRLSDYHIHPVTALGGAIRLNDQLRLAFDLVAWKEG